MRRYAQGTSVSTDRSRQEIESLLGRYGASEFAYATTRAKAMVGFKVEGRSVRFIVELPDRAADEFRKTPGRGKERSESQAFSLWEQSCRQRWRALVLVVKAKLEAIESGIATFEEEFLPYLVMPDGHTIGEHVLPKLAAIYEGGRKLPPLLPDFR